MNLFRDRASTEPRTSGTKVTATAGAAASAIAAAMIVLNKIFGWGLLDDFTREELSVVVIGVLGFMGFLAQIFQRRATERVEKRVKQGPVR